MTSPDGDLGPLRFLEPIREPLLAPFEVGAGRIHHEEHEEIDDLEFCDCNVNLRALRVLRGVPKLLKRRMTTGDEAC